MPDQMGCGCAEAKPKAQRKHGTDPFALFDEWFAEARASEPNDPEAMALATADADGRPSVRMVLLKGHGPDGFVFYTNQREPKGRRARRQSAGGACCSTGSRCAARCGSRARSSACRDDGGRRLFRQPRPRFAARRLGVGPVAPARQPRDVRAALRRDAAPVRGAGRAAPAALGRLSRDPRDGSSSGPTGRTGCTSAGCSSARADGWTEGLLYP